MMAGVSVTATIDDRQVVRGLGGLMLLMRNGRPMMGAIGTGLVSSTHQRFITQTDPDGQPWQTLNPLYAEGKKNTRILTESGRLRNSINDEAGNDWVRVGTNTIYAAAHQLGAVITPKHASHLFFRMGGSFIVKDKVTLPARPFLGISEDDRDMIADVVGSYIVRFSRTH